MQITLHRIAERRDSHTYGEAGVPVADPDDLMLLDNVACGYALPGRAHSDFSHEALSMAAPAERM